MAWQLFAKKKRYMLLIDVASGSVGLALSTHRHNKPSKPKILAFEREPIRFKNTNTAEALAQALAQALQKAGARMQKTLAHLRITPAELDTHAVVHAPWGIAQTESVAKEYDTPFLFTSDFFHEFLKEAFPVLLDEAQEVAAAYVMQLQLNGYPIDVPKEVRATSLSVTLLILHMHPLVMQAIQDFVVQHMHTEPAYLASFPYAVTALAAAYGNDIPEYTLLDVGEVFTQLTVIKEGAFSRSGEVAFGVRDIYESIAKRMRVSEEVARSRMRMFQEGTLVPTGRRQIRSILETHMQEWTKAFGDTCAQLAKQEPLPETIFLFADELFYPLLKEQISRIDFAPFTITARPFTVQPIISPSVARSYFAKQITSPDQRLLVDALFVDLHAPKLKKNALLHPLVSSLLEQKTA